MNPTKEEYYELFAYSYAKKNYVAIKTILDCCDIKKLLNNLLMNDEQNMSIFLIIGSGIHLYDLAMSFRHNACLPKLISLAWGSENDFKQFSQPIAQYKTLTDWEIEKKITHLNNQIRILSRFTTALDEKIKATRCYEDRFSCNVWKKLFVTITFLALATGIGFASQTHCWMEGDKYASKTEKCNDNFIPGLLLTMIPSMGALIILGRLIYDVYNGHRRQIDAYTLIKVGRSLRFYDRPIRQHNDEIQQAATGIFAEFAENKVNRFTNRTLDSNVSDILADINEMIQEKKNELSQLQRIPETKIEVAEVKTEPQPADEDWSDLFIKVPHSPRLFSHIDTVPLLALENKREFKGPNS